MTLTRFAQNGRLRRRVVEPGLAAFAALLLISAAQAALPEHLPKVSLQDRRTPVAAAKPAAPEPVVLISFSQPVAGYPIVSPFGLRQMPWENHGRLHEGVDIAAPEGLPITASADGVVTRAGDSPTYGRYVEIQHVEGLVSFYAHMGAIDAAIASGVAVKAGTRIGAIGDSGTSTGPHLHFEVRDADDRPLNPQAFLGKSFASADLLPLRQAARISNHVRLAQVSRIPASKRDLMEAKLDKKAGKPPVQAKSGTWMQARLDDRDRVRAQVRFIAAEQHKQAGAPSADAAGTPASAIVPNKIAGPPTSDSAIAPIKIAAPELQLPS